MYQTSSAGRLWEILNRAKEYAKPHSDSFNPPTISEIWCEVLEVEPPQLLEAHLNILQLITEVIEDFKIHYDGDEDAYMDPIHAVAEALRKVAFDSDWSTLEEYVTPSFMAFLKLSNRQISLASIDNVLSDEELNELRQLADDLYIAVCSSHINISLRAILITIVRELQNAILNYQFFGVVGICKANERILGSSLLNMAGADEEAEQSILKRCIDATVQIAQIVKIGYDLTQIATALAYTYNHSSLPEANS